MPDLIYAEAAQVAASVGLEVDAYILEAVRKQIKSDRPLGLSAEQIEACARAEADIEAGRTFTADQVRDHFVAKNRQP